MTKNTGSRDAAIYRRYVEDQKTYTEIGEEFGLSRERVRQIILSIEPGAPKRIRERRREQREWQQYKTEAELREAAVNAGAYCLLCGDLVTRRAYSSRAAERGGFALTCSTEHAHDYEIVRDLVDREARDRHRRNRAEHILRHREKYDDPQTRWAERFLAGEAERRTPSFQVGSKRYEIARKYGLVDETATPEA